VRGSGAWDAEGLDPSGFHNRVASGSDLSRERFEIHPLGGVLRETGVSLCVRR
jgi:hypothetical protein